MSGSSPLRFLLLASGAGSNARTLLSLAKERPELLAAVALVTDREGVPALDIAKEFGVEARVIPPKEPETLLAFLREKDPQWACLAGYKRLVPPEFLRFFHDASLGFARVINVHPSLLPAYPGLRGYERAFADGVKVSGVTVHLVDEGLDTGRVILQEAFTRDERDDASSFVAKGRALERKLFPQALALAAEGRIRLRAREGAHETSRWVSLEKL